MQYKTCDLFLFFLSWNKIIAVFFFFFKVRGIEIGFVFQSLHETRENYVSVCPQDFLPFPDLPRAVSSFAVSCSARSRNARHARKEKSGRERVRLEKKKKLYIRARDSGVREIVIDCIA